MKVLLIEDNPGDARLVKEMLADAEGGPYQIEWAETLIKGLDCLSHNHFDVVVVDLSLPDSNGLDTFTTIRTHAPRIPLVLMTGLDNDALALRAVEDGAQDYLVKGKLDGDSLARSLRYAVVRHNKLASWDETEPARLIGIMGAKGGVGTTTFACHFAVEWRKLSGRRTLFTDLDADSASSGFLFKSNSPCSLLDASTSLHRLDTQLLKGMIWTGESGLEFLQPPGWLRVGDRLNSDRLRHVIRFLRTIEDTIIVDMCRFNALTMGMLDEIQELFLVTTPHVQSLYETRRILSTALEMGLAAARIHLVLNRLHKRSLVSRQEVEKALGFPVYAELPECEYEIEEAYSEGKTLREGSPAHLAIARAAAKMLGLEYKPVQKRRLLFA